MAHSLQIELKYSQVPYQRKKKKNFFFFSFGSKFQDF